MSVFQFPHGFLWGAATSAHQVEGGNRNDWTEWELANAERLAREAEARYVHWLPSWNAIKPQAQDPKNYISGRATDHYRRFREDFDIAKRLGHNAHRFSIEWSHIEPEEGKFNEQEIEHYREVIKALRERDIEPFVSLWHWTLPLWVRNQGGWENKKTVKYFLRFVDRMAASLGNTVRFWIPLNEPTVYTGHSYVIGAFPPQVRSFRRANRVLKNLLAAHRWAYKVIHHRLGNAVEVGSVFNFHYHVPARPRSYLDILATRIFDYLRDWRPLRWTHGRNDFIGLNYYFRDTIRFVGRGGRFGIIDILNPNEWVSDLGWDIYPEGIYHIARRLSRYRLPIYVTENGVADMQDRHRTRFIREHLQWLGRAIAEGADVRGYFHWSLLDNFEWDNGFWPRFGLVAVDYKTLERKIRPSAWEYKKIIESSSIELS